MVNGHNGDLRSLSENPIWLRAACFATGLRPAVSTIYSDIACFAVLASHKTARSRANDGVLRQTPSAELPGHGIGVTLAFGGRDELEETLMADRAAAVHRGRRAELKLLEIRMERVACHVTDSPCAKIPPRPPVGGMIRRVIRAIRRRADPQVPVHTGWRSLYLCRSDKRARIHRMVAPDVQLSDRADHSRREKFRGASRSFSAG